MDPSVEIQSTETYNFQLTYESLLQEILDFKSLIKQNGVNVVDDYTKNVLKSLKRKFRVFLETLNKITEDKVDIYSKNYLFLYNFLLNTVNDLQGMFGKSSKLEIEELNKRKAYYTSQELGKRTNTIYYIQTLYILIYIVFIVEVLRSTKYHL